jgi:hypothetical protein
LASALRGDIATGRTALSEVLLTASRYGDASIGGYATLGLALCTRDDRQATILYAAAKTRLDGLGETIEPVETGIYERETVRLRESLGDIGYDEASRAGRMLTADGVIDLILSAESP